ncbi:3191_t:CDS:2 [Paraglomus occultum]|uniref:3191_t:CDS:1 n=1 Tax=Paraglomus occultum TaxID=144539 RepID=A0A9N9F2Y9_9GLOM|nr:3191_t:CDS:2 [Paraglomus occultum]
MSANHLNDPIGNPVSKKADALATDLICDEYGVIRSLRKYLGASVETAKKLKTYNIQIVGMQIIAFPQQSTGIFVGEMIVAELVSYTVC